MASFELPTIGVEAWGSTLNGSLTWLKDNIDSLLSDVSTLQDNVAELDPQYWVGRQANAQGMDAGTWIAIYMQEFTGPFVVPATGVYRVEGYASWTANADGTRSAGISVNSTGSSGIIDSTQVACAPSPTNGWATGLAIPAATVSLTEGDEVRVVQYQNSGVHLTTATGSWQTSLTVTRIPNV